MPGLAVRTLSGTIALFNKGENEMGEGEGCDIWFSSGLLDSV